MMNRGTAQAGQKGFTLIELLVVLAILVTILLIALPDYLNTILPEHRIRAAARDVMTDMRYARMRSVSRNLEYRITFSPGTDSYIIEAGNRSRASDTWTQEGTTRNFSNPGNPFFHSHVGLDTGTTASVLYRPTGEVMPAPTVQLSHPKAGTWRVYGSLAGRVRLEKG
jgi:prepilin-type N-terminal cleavage/methylation domain-containing protein